MEFRLEFGERVMASVRKHWFVYVLELIPYVLLAFLPLLVPGILEKALSFSAFENAEQISEILYGVVGGSPWVKFGYGMWLLLLWSAAFHTFTRYYLNMWVITSTRIVYIHQHGFFRREVSSFLLTHVQDVTTEVYGLFATILGYGSINVETAGDSSKSFSMDGIPSPTRYRDLIMKEIAGLHKKEKK